MMSSFQNLPLGQFEGQTDIGSIAQPGSCEYALEEQTYTISGAGANIWGEQDDFHFVWKRMVGDFIVTMRAAFIGAGVNPHRKLGWMARSSLDGGSPHASAIVHGDGLVSLQFRRTQGGQTEEERAPQPAADVIQLERRGNTYIMSGAKFGQPFTSVQVADVDLGEAVYVGLCLCSHETDVIEQAVFSNVRIVVPVKEGFERGRDPFGSHLELLEVLSGHRKIIYSSEAIFEAPNWTRDGRALIYNQDGRLVRFDLATGMSSPIDTGEVVRNNNDHVLSFDGSMLAISSHSQADYLSRVYTVPLQGGKPRLITPRGPSYLHGWSPDGKFLVFAGQRRVSGTNKFDIFKISVSGGDEVKLTEAPGVNDGPEYTPDGKYIYFNSSRTGRMQIWRMKPDGSDQEQVTHDDFNNWFAHISPDGSRFVFISFPADIPAGDHPYYKHCYLRLMPITGGTPKVIAYLYGGQGTMNVPSWSPDGKKIAFVSNNDIH